MKIASFDVFDTCLQLKCGNEEQFLFILAYTILGDNAIIDDIYEFVRIRKQAEVEARKQTTQEEITTSEIYYYCNFSAFTSLPNEQILQTEYMLVKQLLYPIFTNAKKITQLRDHGWSILYISDMHLPQQIIKDALLQNNLFIDGIDKLFVSSQFNKTKNSGTLYKHIKEHIHDKIEKWIHIGDNQHSDYTNAKKNGIHAQLFKRCKHLNYSYKAIKSESNYIQRPLFTASSLSKSIYYTSSPDAYSAMYLDLIAPFFTSSVYKILNDAQQRGIKDLLFFARDSYVLYYIAQKLQLLYPNINFHYISISRKVIYLPSVQNISYNGFISLKNIKGLSLADYLDQFSLSVDELIIDETENIEQQIRSIFNFPTNIELITQRQNELVEYLLSYILQFVPFMNNMAMVDMTGSRSSQLALNNLLRTHGYPSLHAYYLLVSEDRKSVFEAGKFTSILYADYLKHGIQRYIGDLALLFEDVFSITNQNRTIGYKKVGHIIEPIYDNEQNQWKTSYMNKNLSLLDKYIGGYLSTKLYLSNCEILQSSIRNLGYFARNPLYIYVKSLENFHISENTSNNIQLLSKPWKHDSLWYRGSIVYLGSYMNDFIDIIYKFKHTD